MEALLNARNEIRKILDSQTEWLLVQRDGTSFALQASEIELELNRERLLLGFLDARGFWLRRITGWKYEKEKLFFELTENFEREKMRIELVPRISSKEFSENVELARLEKANKIANLIVSAQPDIKLVRVELNKENGRFAQIILQNSEKKQIAVMADVSETLTPEVLLTSAILWLEKLRHRRRNPIETIWILAEKKTADDLQKIHALLRESWRGRISIWEICNSESKEDSDSLKELEAFDLHTLFASRKRKARPVKDQNPSETALKIAEISTAEIDISRNKSGETIYFKGLAFARIRAVLNEEKIWFGIEAERRFLSPENIGDFDALIDELKAYRKFDSPNKQHLFYKHAPEAWLESNLRKNIKLLDANLILSPLYNQFRADRNRIDLLALRRDGRLAIIEVKTSPDREMIFQAADYWRRIEMERRHGNLQKMKLFGDLKIKDEPALVYLVAPLLSYHRDFNFLAQIISPEIEIYRFDTNENWRENLKIVRRQLISEITR